jgi:hypothetical protein
MYWNSHSACRIVGKDDNVMASDDPINDEACLGECLNDALAANNRQLAHA